jgi:hypothetical protein
LAKTQEKSAIDGCRQHARAVVLKGKENVFVEICAGRQLVDISVGITMKR